MQERIATNIPPSQRTKREKKLAGQYFARLQAEEEPDSWPRMGPTTRAIHHWLIGQAAACLDRFQSEKDPTFKIRGALIARLFEAAFEGLMVTEESVKKELRRQREQGKPDYILPAWR
jgi:hypothetical protein